MPSWLIFILALAAVLAIFNTTAAGQRLVRALGIDALNRNGPPREDREFLLRACGGDESELARRIAAERSSGRDFTEAELYRRAIRTYMNRKTEDLV